MGLGRADPVARPVTARPPDSAALRDRALRNAYPRVAPAAPGATHRYRVADRDAQRRITDPPPIVEIVVSASCPECGAARDEPRDREVFDHFSQAMIRISGYRRTCPHYPLETDLLREARTHRADTA
jgi:hypothetical protein